MLVTVGVTTVAWLTVTFPTPAEPDACSTRSTGAYAPAGPGGAPIAMRTGFGPEPLAVGRLAWINWIAGIVAAYATLFGIGKLIFGPVSTGIGMLAVAGVAFAWIAWSFRQETPPAAARATGTAPGPAPIGAD